MEALERMLFNSKPSKSKTGPAPFGKAAAPSILSLDLEVTGDIVTSGEVHVSGTVKGDITAGNLTIGEGGSVTGAVEVETALVAGMLTGRLTATAVTLARTARVVADITHVALIIEEGAVFEGNSRRVDSIDQAKAAMPLALAGLRPAAATPFAGRRNSGARADHEIGQGTAAATP